MRSKRRKKYKLLLDEGVHLPRAYPKLNNLHKLTHVSEVGLRGSKDEKVFKYAFENSLIVVVFNIKDFKKFIRPDKPTIITLSTNLTDEQADLKICKALRELKSTEANGCLITITKSGISKKIYDDLN